MSARRNSKASIVQDAELDSFLRSINLCFDADYPERIAHFRPTAKCVRLMTALAGQEKERAYFVVAPYGSGKSIASSYLLQLVENRPEATPVLKTIEHRLQNVSDTFADFSRSRRRRGLHGLVIAMQGYCPSFPDALKNAILDAMGRQSLGREARTIREMPANSAEDAIAILKVLLSKADNSGLDRVVLIWDEFGRHIESLVADGRTSQLNDIQTLAEFAARCKALPFTIGLILHQDLFNYASNLPQAVRSEWKKVEGRFQTLQYVDLSRETYRLIADLVHAKRGTQSIDLASAKKLAKAYRDAGLFGDFTAAELPELLQQSYPMEPAAFWVLPRIAARVAQNERTLFSFLGTVDFRTVVTPATIFDYFSSLMQADIGVGGTYKKWLETQTAIEKVTDIDGAASALKCIALLGFNVSGQRGVVSAQLTDLALAGFGPNSDAAALRKQLLGRKVLLHRKHSDEISIWHGSDIDLRGHLNDEKTRQRPAFDVFAFLRKEAPLNVWRPTRYNDEYLMHRYFRSVYASLADLQNYMGNNLTAKNMPDTWDGVVLYFVPESPEQLAEAESMVAKDLRHLRVVAALPRSAVVLKEACLEVWSLVSLQGNQELVGSDPLVLPELRQMTDDARAHLDRTIQSLIAPRINGPRWFYRGKEISIGSSRGLRSQISSVMESVYSKTPKLNNESVIRHQPSATIVNSRKKLEIGILERSGMPNLGIEGDFPDSSMFRTILHDTGIYTQNRAGLCQYAQPKSIEEPGLAAVWQLLHDFFTTPATGGKSFADIIDALRRPPYGVRNGVVPILIAAAFRAFPSAFALDHKSRGYITDIRPSDIEDLCNRPDTYQLLVYGIDKETTRLLKGITKTFADSTELMEESDVLRAAWDAVREWYFNLPAGSRTSILVSIEAIAFRRLVDSTSNPADLFFRGIPNAFGRQAKRTDATLKLLGTIREELESVAEVFYARARDITLQCFGFESTTPEVQGAAQRWARCFPSEFIGQLVDRHEKGVFKRIAVSYPNSERFIDAISVLLDCGPVSAWSDTTVSDYQRRLTDLVAALEDRAVTSSGHLFPELDAREQFASLFVDRIGTLAHKLSHIVGQERAQSHLAAMLAQMAKETSNGINE